MGRYTKARKTLATALEEHQESGRKQLPESLETEAKGYLGEIDSLLAKVLISIAPERVAISVDGRPLEAGDGGIYVAGTRPPGPGEPAPKGSFQVLLDPGAHVFTFSRKGFT